jgi:Leucine-rich repeat (LRR) protein
VQLQAANNHLKLLPAGLFALSSKLRFLNLSNNALTALPADLFGTVDRTSLRMVDLTGNQLSTIPASFFHHLGKINTIILSNNRLTAWSPSWLTAQTMLTRLEIAGNQLRTLTEDMVADCLQLETFQGADNPWEVISLGKLQFDKLTTFRVGSAAANGSIEYDFAYMPNLITLDARGMMIPAAILKAMMMFKSSLRVVSLGGPSICDPHDPIAPNFVHFEGGSSTLVEFNVENTTCESIFISAFSKLLRVSVHSSALLELVLLQNQGLDYLNVSGNLNLWALQTPSAQTIDLSFTNVSFRDTFGISLGSYDLYLQGMVNQASYQDELPSLIANCFSSTTICELSQNSFVNNVTGLNIGFSRYPILLTQARAPQYSHNYATRTAMSAVQLGDAPVQCQLELQSSGYVAVSHTAASGGVQAPLRIKECSCSPGFVQREDGSCFLVHQSLWDLFRRSRAAVALLSLFIILLVGAPLVVLIRKRLARLSERVELQQYLLADAEEDVLALQKGWQIGGDEIELLSRIDVDSPGAFGEVWKADWEGLSVCVKVLKQRMSMDESLADFDAEISFLQRTRSPYLVRFFGAGQLLTSQAPFLVLELMELGSLHSYLQRRTVADVSWACRVSIAQDIARGMDYIHNTLHKLHRDLKSGNVLCTGSAVAPRVKIGDFGSIKEQLAHDEAIPKQRTSNMQADTTNPQMTRGIGTPVYMAIEVIRCEDYDGKAEVWSYGVLLYEIATHRIPDLLTELPKLVVGSSKGPYLGQVLKLLEEGHRLVLDCEVAEAEPAWYRPLMARCLQDIPGDRPSFGEITDLTN